MKLFYKKFLYKNVQFIKKRLPILTFFNIISSFKIQYICKRDGCDNCSATEECLCNSPRQLSPQQNICINICQNGFILDKNNSQNTPCSQLCPSWCKKCNSSLINECFECQQSGQYITLIDKKCGNCEADEVPINNFCTKCNNSCASCFGLLNSECKVCKTNGNYIQEYNNNLCGICDTENGYFIDGQKCRRCHISCKKCNGPNQNQCLACFEHYFLNNQTSTCDQCHSDCKFCSGSKQTECIQCQNNQQNIAWNTNICRQCQTNEFIENYKCNLCPDTCASCKNLTECTSCVQGQHFVLPSYKACGQCLSNQYLDVQTNQCRKCDSSCSTCTGPLNRDCKSCTEKDYYINLASLCGLCGNQYYGDQISNHCKPCHSDCLQCSGPLNTNCLSCKNSEDYLCLDENKCTKKCIKCFEGCSECFGSLSNQCTKCKLGILQPDNTCQKKCPIRQYYEESTNTCQDCISDCLTCSNNYICDVCDVDNIFKSIFDVKGICINCPINSYYDVKLKNCFLCHSSCLQCSGPEINNCRRCDEKTYLTQDKTCVQECPINFIKNDIRRVCQSCKYQNDICVLECSEGYFLDKIHCRKCLNNCRTCTSEKDCSECFLDYYFKYSEIENETQKQVSCVKCNSQEYIYNQNECQMCNLKIENCQSCEENQQNLTCNNCSFKYNLTKYNTCVIKSEYINLECETNEECQQQQLISDKIKSGFTVANIITTPFSLISCLSFSMGPVFWYSLQNFQMIGNFALYQNSYKAQGLGPVVMNQFYQYNILPLFPKINIDKNPPQNSVSQQSLLHQNMNTQQTNNQLYKQRVLYNIGDIIQKENKITNSFIVNMIYWFILLLIFGIILIISFIFKRIKAFQYLLYNKNKIFVYYVTYFSNYSIMNVLLTIQNIRRIDLSISGIISCVLLIILVLIYFLALYKLKTGIDENTDTNFLFLNNIITLKSYQKYFWVLFEIRKIASIVVIVFVSTPSIISQVIFCLYLAFFAYLCICQPINNINILRLFQIQELLFAIVFFNLFLSYEVRSIRGVSNLITIFILASMIIVVFFLSSSMIFRLLKQFYLYLKNRKNKKTENEIMKASITYQQFESTFEIPKIQHSISLSHIRKISNYRSLVHIKLFDRQTNFTKKDTIIEN